MSIDMLGRKDHPGCKVLAFCFPFLPITRHPGLSALVTFHTWSMASTLLEPNCLPYQNDVTT